MTRRRGTAAAVTAAFLGPGTITTCSLAGVHHGLSLLWVLLVSLGVLLVAQESCVRLGALGRASLSQALMRETDSGVVRAICAVLVVAAVGIGCAAYQAGNLKGAAQGLLVLAPLSEARAFWLCTAAAAVLLLAARREHLLAALLVFVLLMTVCFLLAAWKTRPALDELGAGLLVPRIPAGGLLAVAGLVGTTIVPYNLFLQSSLVRDQALEEDPASAYRRERRSLLVFLPLGVVVSASVVLTAAGVFHAAETEAPRELSAMGAQLEQPLGRAGSWAFGLGVLCAGLSSALTAPLAAGLAIAGLHPRAPRGLATAIAWTVLAAGAAAGFTGGSPTRLIQFAQITNALLLPVSLLFLVWVVSRRRVLGAHARGPVGILLGAAAFLVTLGLAVRTAGLVFGFLS